MFVLCCDVRCEGKIDMKGEMEDVVIADYDMCYFHVV